MFDSLLSLVPNQPQSLRQKNVGTSYIEVEWNDPYDSFQGFELKYQKNSGGEESNVDIENKVNSYQIENLDAGVQYMISLRTKSGNEYSSSVSKVFQTGG